jgi:hypothetical protein
MAIYQTGAYQVKPSAVDKVKQAIQEFVRYVQTNEPGRCIWHGNRKMIQPGFYTCSFSRTLLVGGDVVFTNYELVAGKR